MTKRLWILIILYLLVQMLVVLNINGLIIVKYHGMELLMEVKILVQKQLQHHHKKLAFNLFPLLFHLKNVSKNILLYIFKYKCLLLFFKK